MFKRKYLTNSRDLTLLEGFSLEQRQQHEQEKIRFQNIGCDYSRMNDYRTIGLPQKNNNDQKYISIDLKTIRELLELHKDCLKLYVIYLSYSAMQESETIHVKNDEVARLMKCSVRKIITLKTQLQSANLIFCNHNKVQIAV